MDLLQTEVLIKKDEIHNLKGSISHILNQLKNEDNKLQTVDSELGNLQIGIQEVKSIDNSIEKSRTITQLLDKISLTKVGQHRTRFQKDQRR